MRCFLECSTKTEKALKHFKKRSHWHCCLCPQLFDRISEFRIHLTNHNKSTMSSFQQGQKLDRTADPEMQADTDVQEAKKHKHKADNCTECGKQCRSERALQTTHEQAKVKYFFLPLVAKQVRRFIGFLVFNFGSMKIL